jgi:hypothetical protein
VLFEMATAVRAAATLERESALDGLSSPQFAHVARRCLEKDPENRWQSAHDVAVELRWTEQASAPPKLMRRRVPFVRQWTGWVVAAVLLTGVTLSRFASRPDPHEARTVEFNVPRPAESVSFAMDVAVAVSPDGAYLALRAVGADGKESLWVRSLDSSVARLLPGTAGAMGFFWSPDNRSIGFVSDGKLRKIDIRGGPAVELCNFPTAVSMRVEPGTVKAPFSLRRVETKACIAFPTAPVRLSALRKWILPGMSRTLLRNSCRTDGNFSLPSALTAEIWNLPGIVEPW